MPVVKRIAHLQIVAILWDAKEAEGNSIENVELSIRSNGGQSPYVGAIVHVRSDHCGTTKLTLSRPEIDSILAAHVRESGLDGEFKLEYRLADPKPGRTLPGEYECVVLTES